MRTATLFLRSRDVPAGTLWAVPAMAAVAWLGAGPAGSRHAVTAAALALALGVAVLGHGLGGPDSTLDATAAIRWAPRRALHLIAIGTVAVAVVTVVTTVPVAVVLRDAAGFTGLAGLAAVLFGRRLTWTLPVVTGCVSAGVPAVPGPFALYLLTWAGQPADSGTALTVGVVLAVTGGAAYTARGPRRLDPVS
ncbi:hypothetical protein AMIS_79580 [Actinoplanes missouriensis 431]|uniref:Uncharacterized protein n=1 Tax=Actinoplanes missouriensis (strain ATCC 14538 / DSM 43046 / CBS 188.64 / JCM 3121 / NBRC 102363 / NCIMB 12654 / NRRL B-3342 / UNCC 431) TaxID=512565 RepID=I0HJJ1_ACTM4|nr:hypothetical protein [Actinoplanes missouriensis]BAL93178.1 hypothetical protein AMIS_79580 [Actinoplanes missouriensis 431]